MYVLKCYIDRIVRYCTTTSTTCVHARVLLLSIYGIAWMAYLRSSDRAMIVADKRVFFGGRTNCDEATSNGRE